MTTFEALIKNRRSIRKYLDKSIETEKVDAILRTALMSPASKRANGWEFIVVDQRETLVKLAACREVGSKFVADAPLAIVVAYDTEKCDVWYEDASIAAIIIQLAAADLDLGSCWVQVHNRTYNDTTTSEAYVRDLLQIPHNYHVLCMITIGYKDEERKPYDVEKLAYDKIHYNKF
ncbi:MAG TPA: nitroreductase family protein [Paludibacteraceae bacterium]|nr:nitroreductase family protein [Paludibacteraceae bacterium]